MKVKIVKCKENHWWYKDRIGEVFELITNDNIDCWVKAIGADDTGFVYKEDCIIIEEGKMTRKEELMREMEKVKQQFDSATEAMSKLKQELENIEEIDWLQDGVEYWYISSDGDYIDWTKYYSHDEDIYRKSVGNTYKTRALAERKRDKIKSDWVLQKIIKVQNYVDNLEEEDWEADWSDIEQRKYYICYSYVRCEWVIESNSLRQSDVTYMSESTAKRVIKMLERGEI